MTFEELIADVVKRGEVSHLSVASVAGGFAASFTPCGTFDRGLARDPDPIKAMTKAITGVKLARRKVEKPGDPRVIHDTPDNDLDFG